jgi:hypothetical protein
MHVIRADQGTQAGGAGPLSWDRRLDDLRNRT